MGARRLGIRAATTAAAFALLIACTAAPTEPPETSPATASAPVVGPDPTTTPPSAATSELRPRRVVTPLARSLFGETRDLVYSAQTANHDLAVLAGDEVPQSVVIVDRDTGAELTSFAVEAPYRYVGRVRLVDDYALALDSPDLDNVQTLEPARLVRLPLSDGDVVEIEPPVGTTWSYLPGLLVELDGAAVGVVNTVPDGADYVGTGDCVALIDVDAATSRILTCWEGRKVSFLEPSDRGVSVLSLPLGDDLAGERQRTFVPLDGGQPTQIAAEPVEYRPYDGLLVGDWEIWTEVRGSVLGFSMLYARRGDIPMSLGIVVTGSLAACGGYVYWYTDASDPDDRTPTPVSHLHRWEPGSRLVARIDAPQPDTLIGGTDCQGGVLTTTSIDLDGLTQSYTFDDDSPPVDDGA